MGRCQRLAYPTNTTSYVGTSSLTFLHPTTRKTEAMPAPPYIRSKLCLFVGGKSQNNEDLPFAIFPIVFMHFMIYYSFIVICEILFKFE